jgi:glycosyltransferase involved in cell wall biosynthesis
MRTILLISPYWKEPHRWMASSVKLAELWQRRGYRVVAACMGGATRTEVVSPTLTIHFKKDLFLPDPLNFGICPGFGGLVRRLIREEKPDLVVCNKVLFWTSFSVPWLTLLGHRVTVLTDALVGMTWWPRSRLAGWIMAAGAWTMGWLVLASAERVVFFHPQPEALLKRLGIAGKSRVIPQGIDPAPYGPTPERGADGKTVVTYVGRLESVKGADDFAAAVAPLKRQFPELVIRVAGWYKPGHPLVEEFSDRIEFLGLRDDVPAVLGASDIFVMPSYSEGLSNAIMEAMASGCAVVASEVGGNRYLVENGVTGLLFPAGDRAALQAHVRRLLEDRNKRERMGEAARAKIEREFSWEVVGEKYAQLFEEA